MGLGFWAISPIFRREDEEVAGFTSPKVEVCFSKVLLKLLVALEGGKAVDADLAHLALEHLSRLKILFIYLPLNSVANCSLNSGR